MKRFVLPALIFAYALMFRVHGIEDHFQLYADQIRDWKIVSGTFLDLPLLGTSRNSGGFSHGPIFYWILWLSRQIIGPSVDQLPHAGGIGIAIFYAISAALLYRSLLLNASFVFATTAILFIVSSPWEASFSGNTAWNPGVAVALVNFAFAAFLAARRWRGRIVSLILAWLAFQAHFPAIFVFLGLALGAIVCERQANDSRRTLGFIAVTIVAVIILEIPYLVAQSQGLVPEGSPVQESLAAIVQNPMANRATHALRFIKNGAILLLFEDQGVIKRYAILLFLVWIIGAFRFRHDLRWQSVAVFPIAVALFGYAISQIQFDAYHLVTLLPAFALLFVLGVRGIAFMRIPLWILLAYVLIQQPGRFERAPTDRMESYGALVRGARAIVASGKKISQVEFQESRTDPMFVIECLGGKQTAGAPIAMIHANGDVEWRE